MSEIFISYAREDKTRVEALAKALEDCGWSVWWDPHIPTGKRFDDVIEQAIAEAKCIIVVWSRSSVSSSYVRAEASEGAERQILFPVLIEEVRIPLAFRQIQTASLIDWNGSRQHPGFDKLIRDISLKLTPQSTPEPATPDSANVRSTPTGRTSPRPVKKSGLQNPAVQLWRILHFPLFKITAVVVSTALVIIFVMLIYWSRQEGNNRISNTSIKNQNSAASEVTVNKQLLNENITMTAGGKDAFTIELQFKNRLTEKQMNAFKLAADRWSRIIIGDLPDAQVDGEDIDDVLIIVQGADIDGPGGILGQAGPTRLRSETAGGAAYLPLKGTITIDNADLAHMEEEGTLEDFVTHEMGRVLGIGTIPRWTKLIQGGNTSDPVFIGKNARREYAELSGVSETRGVPVENIGGAGTRNAGWRESIFRNEVMTGFISSGGNLISRVTAGALEDLGYKVNYDGTDNYKFPRTIELQGN